MIIGLLDSVKFERVMPLVLFDLAFSGLVLFKLLRDLIDHQLTS